MDLILAAMALTVSFFFVPNAEFSFLCKKLLIW
jgi:hypothetical protein